MRKPALETKETQSFEKMELLYTLLITGEKGALALCLCNSPAYRRQLETELAQRLKKDRIALHILELKPGIMSIVRAIKEKIDSLSSEPGWRLALSVSGIENTISEEEQKGEGRPKSLNSLNLQRDFFLDFPYPIALWIPEWVAKLLQVKAPDFWVVRTSVFEFRPTGEEMQEYAQAISEFAPFYDNLEDLERRIRIYQKMIAGFGQNDKAAPYLWWELGKLFQAKGEMDTAQRYLEEGLNRAQQVNDAGTLYAFYHGLGKVNYIKGNLDESEELYRTTLRLSSNMGNKMGIAASLHELGMIERQKGNLDKAEGLYQESLKLSLDMGNKIGIAWNLHQLAMIEQDRGNPNEAERLYQDSLKLAREMGDKRGIAYSLHQLAMIEQGRGNLDKGEGLYHESLKLAREMGDKRGLARSLHQLAMIEQDKGNLEEALKLYVQALDIFSSAGYAEKEITLGNLEKLHQKMGAERFEKVLKEANIELPPLTRKLRKVPSPKNNFIPLALTGRGKGEGE